MSTLLVKPPRTDGLTTSAATPSMLSSGSSLAFRSSNPRAPRTASSKVSSSPTASPQPRAKSGRSDGLLTGSSMYCRETPRLWSYCRRCGRSDRSWVLSSPNKLLCSTGLSPKLQKCLEWCRLVGLVAWIPSKVSDLQVCGQHSSRKLQCLTEAPAPVGVRSQDDAWADGLSDRSHSCRVV